MKPGIMPEMNAADAAQQLMRSLGASRAPVTIADAATRSGLPLRDAERGLHWLTKEYRGHLRVTNDGDLLFLFPSGFTKPWVVPTAMGNAARAVARGVKTGARYVLRAWLSIVVVLYVLAFVAILLLILFGSMAGGNDRKSSSRSSGGALDMLGGLFRVVAEVLFWTSPSPYSRGYGAYGYSSFGSGQTATQRNWRNETRGEKTGDEVPFHERVNRFVFGPPPPPDDRFAREQAILAQIREGKGRVGLADVMRVTGLPRSEVDPMMARLMVDYEGEVDVSPDGGIAYRFESLRKTADASANVRVPEQAWNRAQPKPPLTGNTASNNLMIAGLNAFNLVMGYAAFASHLTVENIMRLVHGVRIDMLPQTGTAVLLGIVPMLFSLAILAAPVLRAPFLPIARAKAAFENGRRAVTDAVLKRVQAKQPVAAADLESAWKRATGSAPDERTLTRVVVSLGGDVDLEAAEKGATGVRYRFDDLELEAAAVEDERKAASDAEARVGEVVFASDN